MHIVIRRVCEQGFNDHYLLKMGMLEQFHYEVRNVLRRIIFHEFFQGITI